MTKQKIYLGLVLFILGFMGILSILTMTIPLPADVEAILNEKFSPIQIKLLLLVNPTILLVIAITVGLLFYEKVKLTVPIIEKLTGNKNSNCNLGSILLYGIAGGIIAGILITLISSLFSRILPKEFLEIAENIKPSLAARFLYGGFTEELMMRFGLMTLFVLLFNKIIKDYKPISYWLGIIVAAFIFAAGHLPIAFQAVENPSILLIIYILIGNSVGGIIFGRLYWKKGLESAFIAHIFTHITVVSIGLF